MREIEIARIETENVKRDLIASKEVEEILQDRIVTVMKEVNVVILGEIVTVRELKDPNVIVKDRVLLSDKVVLEEEAMQVSQQEGALSMIIK